MGAAKMGRKRLAKVVLGALGLGAATWLTVGPASASGDYGCTTSWSLDAPSFGCASSIVLSPGNDTRVNLALLARDRAGLAAKPGTYPDLDWQTGYARNFFDWRLFAVAAYPESQWEDNDYYGSRCVSLKGADAAFAAAVAANGKLKDAERAALIAARGELEQICSSFGADYWLRDDKQQTRLVTAWPVNVTSKAGTEFLRYLQAAAAFYGEEWDGARSGFGGLASASDPWLKETARYMQGRVELNAAQAVSFGDWGEFNPEAVDRSATARAKSAFAAYLSAYPAGRYAASAQGLQRRVDWLSGDLKGLAAAYEAMLGVVEPGSAAEATLIEEIDNKLLLATGAEKAIDSPLLLATYDLMRMRAGSVSEVVDYSWGPPPISEQELAGQEPVFRNHPALYQFLRATYSFYVAGDAQDVIARIPDNSVSTGHSALDFSRQILRGQALAALKDPGEEAFWRRLVSGAGGYYQQPTAELGLALHWEKAGALGKIFAADSPVQESMIRKILIEHSAGPDMLRTAAKSTARPAGERDFALFTLLYKQLSRGQYSGFLADLPLIPRGADKDSGLWDLKGAEPVPLGLFTSGPVSQHYACPSLAETVGRLARNARDAKGQLCLGEFYRLNGFDYFGSGEPEPGTLGSFANQFPGKAIPRAAFYNAVMADPAATRADKAYAYYRAVMCYAPSGNNTCGGEDVPESRRKAWFDKLKRQYGDTRWAKELKYYW